jgi:hypothetical protein
MDTMTMNENRDTSTTYIQDASSIEDSTISRGATRRKQQQQQQQPASGTNRTSGGGRVLNVVHACVEGLPCIPPNVMSTFYDTSSSKNGNHHGMVPNEALDLDSGFIVWCIMIVVVLLVTTMVSCTCCICQGLRHQRVVKSLQLQAQGPVNDDDDSLRNVGNGMMISLLGDEAAAENDRDDHDENGPALNENTSETSPPNDSLMDDPLLSQPLLSSQITSATSLSEQMKKTSTASTSAAAGVGPAGIKKGQREEIV